MRLQCITTFSLFRAALTSTGLCGGGFSLFASAEQCASSPSGISYDVDWGVPSASGFSTLTCLTMTNDRPFQRKEVAYSGIPLAEDLNLFSEIDLREHLVVVGANNKRIPAQFNILSRWGGPLTDTSRPVRWAQVSIPVVIGASTTATFDLRLYTASQLRSADVANDVMISSSGNQHIISTGVAQFTIDQTLTSLISSIQLGTDTLLSTSVRSGPSIIFVPQQSQFGTAPRTLSPSDASITYFEISENEPVKATVLAEGVWSESTGSSMCDTFGSYYANPYESFTFSVSLTFFRGRSDILARFHVRNQCSNGDGSDWTDQSFLIDKASYSLDFSQGIAESIFSSHYYGGPSDSDVSAALSSGSSVTTIVEQRKGGGSPWQRRARVSSGSSTLSSDVAYNAPVVAVSNDIYLVGASLANMRYREPQALRVVGSVVSVDVVGEQQRIGEGKGLWNHAMFFIHKVDSNVQTELQTLRWCTVFELERGILVHASPQYYTNTGAMPPLGSQGASATSIKTSYTSFMNRLHSETVSSNGQLERAKSYGSQTWPDIQFDGYNIDNSSPSENNPRHGYWNPHAHELVEFFRSGDPKWAHDFALPLSWLMTFTAYLNIGTETHDYVRNGLCVTSGGSGEGQWHRSGQGSDDYMYNLAMKHAYVLRPDPIHRRRIEMTGRTVKNRYDRNVPESNRDEYIDRLDISRGVMQHMEAGFNCAEFGRDGGSDCHNWFMAVLSEFIQDNLSTGSICQSDAAVGTSCPQPQTFMQVSMMFEFFMRAYLNYGDLEGGLLKAMGGIPENLYTYAVDKSGSSINYLGDHSYLLNCVTNTARTALVSCSYEDAGDGLYLYQHNINSLLSCILLGQFFKPSLNYCDIIKTTWSSAASAITTTWESVAVNGSGWIKGTSQMMSLIAYGVGMLDVCNGDSPTASPVASPQSPAPTSLPTPSPSAIPDMPPTPGPTSNPTAEPTTSPNTASPTAGPTSDPTAEPTASPNTAPPTSRPTSNPTAGPIFFPTKAPTSSPTPLPTLAPTSECRDSTGRFKFTKPDGKTIYKSCNWVKRKYTAWRCRRVNGTKEACPATCTNCCQDTTGSFTLLKTGEEVDCDWVREDPSERCKPPSRQLCSVTCSEC